MRRNNTYLALAALFLTVAQAGCRQEPLPVSRDAICFSVESAAEVELETKTGAPDDQTYTGIRLYGNTETAAVFDGTTTLTKNNTSGAWEYTPLKYWEKGATYAFRAVYPTQASITSGSGSSVVVTYDSEGTNTGTTFTGEYDLMVASAAAVDADTQVGTPVTLSFQHALTAVRFVFTKGGNDASTTCKIKSLKLNNVSTSGTLTYSGADVAQDDWAPATAPAEGWTFDVGTSGWTVATTNGYTSQWYYTVPQALSGAKLVYGYDWGGDKDTVELSLPGPWAPGTAYVYTIDIAMSRVRVRIAAWDSYEVWVTDIPFPD